jgi:hypothetical protein
VTKSVEEIPEKTSILGDLVKKILPGEESKEEPIEEAKTEGVEILAQSTTPVKEQKPITPLSKKVEIATPSFLQINTNDPAQVALEKAESDLRKLQQQLREQTESLKSFAAN